VLDYGEKMPRRTADGQRDPRVIEAYLDRGGRAMSEQVGEKKILEVEDVHIYYGGSRHSRGLHRRRRAEIATLIGANGAAVDDAGSINGPITSAAGGSAEAGTSPGATA
jgi:hypothetical protein